MNRTEEADRPAASDSRHRGRARGAVSRTLARAWNRAWGRAVVTVLAVALVVTPAVMVWLVMRSQQAAAAAPAVTESTVTASVSTSTFEKTVSGTGTLTPAVQDSVSFTASGVVTAVQVAAGDTVEAGQVLATIDTLSLEADLASTRADLATAQAQLTAAQDDDDGSDAAQATVAARQAAVDVAQAACDDAEENLAAATLVAPNAGLVTAVDIAVGDSVGGSGGGTGAPSASGSAGSTDASSAAITIVGTDAWEVTVGVAESDVPLVQAGNQVELTGDDLTDTVFGTVTAVSPLPSTDSGTASYPVTVAVTGSPEGLHDGVSVTASIVYERRSGVLTVPSAAVTTADDGTTTVDLVAQDGSVTATPVTLGDRDGQDVEVTEGLSEGDTVQYTQSTITRSGNDQEQGGGQLPDGFQVPDPGQLPEGFQPPDGASFSVQGGQGARP